MSRPTIVHPITEVKVPSTGNAIKIRPLLVREEKLLLMAKTSNTVSEILGAIKQIVQSCIHGNFDVNKLAIFDLEFIFLRLRAISINNIAKITVKDPEDESEHNFNVNLDEITVEKNPEEQDTITFDKFAIKMCYPSAALYADPEFTNPENNNTNKLLVSCIESVWEGDKKFDMNAVETLEFIDDLPIPVYAKINKFFETMPKLHYEIKYQNTKGTERTLTLSSLEDFFQFV